jgi:hypothetical protein
VLHYRPEVVGHLEISTMRRSFSSLKAEIWLLSSSILVVFLSHRSSSLLTISFSSYIVMVLKLETPPAPITFFLFTIKKIPKKKKNLLAMMYLICWKKMLYSHASLCYLWESCWTLNFGLKVISELKYMNTWLFDMDIWTWSFITCFWVVSVTLVHLEYMLNLFKK